MNKLNIARGEFAVSYFIWRVKIYPFDPFIPMSLAQLVGILHIICKGWGSKPGYSTSPQLNCVSSSH